MSIRNFCVTFVTAAALSLVVYADAPKPNEAIVGAWTLDKGASDLGATGDNTSQNGEQNGRRGDGFGGRRRGGGGGFGRGGGGFGGQQQTPEQREAAQRMRDAMRQELQAPDHMTIVTSDTTIIITTPDGHTTRLATDGSKIKDDSTGIERKTKWDKGNLVSEVSGLGRGKITETYSIVGDPKQLHVKLEIDGPRKTTQTRVYDLDPK